VVGLSLPTADKGTQIAEVLFDCGVVVEPENAEHFTNAVLQLARDSGQGVAQLGVHGTPSTRSIMAKDHVLREFDRQLRGV